MSLENMELVERAYDAYQRGDVDALVALHDPECEIHSIIGGVEGGVGYRGHEGVRRYWNDIVEAFEDWRPEAKEVQDHGDKLIVRIRVWGRGRDSGVSFDGDELWQALRTRNGLAFWWATYRTEAEALEALGLEKYWRTSSSSAPAGSPFLESD
jgi:ketosteroid isomerase-like protein